MLRIIMLLDIISPYDFLACNLSAELERHSLKEWKTLVRIKKP